MHPVELAGFGNRLDLKAKVLPFNTTRIEIQLPASLVLEKRDDLVLHILLGRGRETGDRRNVHSLPFGKFPDEPTRVKVVGSEIVPPFREAMCFIEHPATDFSSGNRLLERAVS